jgi:hypothetical protein
MLSGRSRCRPQGAPEVIGDLSCGDLSWPVRRNPSNLFGKGYDSAKHINYTPVHDADSIAVLA